MRLGSLVVLGMVFFSAFAGRAAVLAARTVDGAVEDPSGVSGRCIDGAFADELQKQADQLEAAGAAQASADQKRAIIQQHLNERLDELERLTAELAAAAEKGLSKDAAAAGKVAALYEQMKPDLAGEIIGGMDPNFAASLLLAMKSDRASGILGALSPDRAYAITVLMAAAS